MKKRLAVLTAVVSASAMLLTGCQAKELSNEYITVTSYKGVEVEKVERTEVTDEDVEAQIENLLIEHATELPAVERAAEDGDTTVIDFVGKLDGEAFDGGSSEDYILELGSDSFIDGFEDGIIGHKVGETFDLNLTFPEEYGSEELAGKDVVFTVTLNAIVPELTDEAVKVLSDESETIEEYKAELKASLQETNDEAYESSLKEAAWSAVLDNTTVTSYPEEKVQEYVDVLYEQYETMASYYGMEFDEFLSTYMGTDEETFEADVKAAAEEQVKSDLVRDLLLENVKDIDTSDEARQEVYETYAEYYGYEDVDSFLEAMEEAGNTDRLEDLVNLELVQKWTADNCKQVEAKETTEE